MFILLLHLKLICQSETEIELIMVEKLQNIYRDIYFWTDITDRLGKKRFSGLIKRRLKINNAILIFLKYAKKSSDCINYRAITMKF